MNRTVVQYEPLVFGVSDYLSLCIMLSISTLSGIYSAIFKKDNTIETYLFGGRRLSVLPVSLSIMASMMNSVHITGGPVEVYRYGSDFWYYIISITVAGIITNVIFLPVFHSLKINTIYEYLGRRFNGAVRTLCSIIFTIKLVFSMSIIICSCSLTISQVSGINFVASTIIFGTITTFYTTIGGIRAVVWADVIQAIFMFVGTLLLVIRGTAYFGGFGVVWSKNYDTGRIVPPSFSLNPTSHYSIWSWIFGSGLNWTVLLALNQGFLQRFLSVPSLKDARRCVVISQFTVFLFNIIATYLGLLIVAMFVDCDPVRSHKISSADQMVPLFMMHILKGNPGFPGLIIAAIVSGALSTLSTMLNSIAAIVFFDYYKQLVRKEVPEELSNIVLKITVLILGIIVTSLAFLVKHIGNVTHVYLAAVGTLNGPVLGIFVIGLFLPRMKSKATFLGSLVGLAFTCWICMGMNLAFASGNFRYKTKPITVDGCDHNFTTVNSTAAKKDVLVFYKISTLWFTTFGFILTVAVACILNIFLEKNDISKMDKAVISPFIYRFLPKKLEASPETEMALLK